MSQAPPDNGLNGRDPDHAPVHPVHARGPASPVINRRAGKALDDWRLRSLRTGPTGDAPAASLRDDHRRRNHRPLLATVLVFVAVAAIAAVIVQGFVIQPFAVRGDAMTPTLQSGDRILVLEPGLLRGPVRSGDIVVVRPTRSLPCNVVGGGDLVLRVAAVPGNVISSVGDSILVDGRPLRERGWYDRRFGQLGSTPIRRTTLAAGRYFLLADNRSNACDSRTFGPIPKSSIMGEGVAVVGRHGHVSLGAL